MLLATEVLHKEADASLWKGRLNNGGVVCDYWHSKILLQNGLIIPNKEPSVGVLGYAVDEGVRRNQGRQGAVLGPDAIRTRLAKLPLHKQEKPLLDFGNIQCENGDLESSQRYLRNATNELKKQQVFPIVLGGGHDITYGSYMGVRDFIQSNEGGKIGILNFDAHFDLRSMITQPTSGTVFNQIYYDLRREGEEFEYFVLGIQEQGNDSSLFETAKELNCGFINNFECELSNMSSVESRLSQFLSKIDYLYITIDLDGFSSAFAPGVSAPSPLGFEPRFVWDVLDFVFKNTEVVGCDIAELNPTYDIDNHTASLAARLVDFMASKI